jgi:hypothetical protein
MVPAVGILLCASLAMEQGAAKLFADPFTGTDFLHPAMMWMIAVMLPPLLALPLISASSHFEAAWWMQQGLIDEVEWRLAVRRLLRVLFVSPILVLLSLIYLGLGVPFLHVAAHVFMLALLAELMVSMIQTLFSGYPFSRSSQDEELGLKLVVVGLLLEVFGSLIGVVVYHVFYRWWWAYLAGVALMFAIRRSMLTKGLAGNPVGQSGAEEEKPEKPGGGPPPELPRRTAALLMAVKAGKFHTTRLLLTGGADPAAVDEEGRSSLEWAAFLGHSAIETLLREYVCNGEQETPGPRE